MDNSDILIEIRSMKKELVADMKDLGNKIEQIAKGHNELQLEVVRNTAESNTRTTKNEKDISALWDHQRETSEKIVACTQIVTTHTETEKAVKNTKKDTAEWIRWLPALFGLCLGLVGWLK